MATKLETGTTPQDPMLAHGCAESKKWSPVFQAAVKFSSIFACACFRYVFTAGSAGTGREVESSAVPDMCCFWSEFGMSCDAGGLVDAIC